MRCKHYFNFNNHIYNEFEKKSKNRTSSLNQNNWEILRIDSRSTSFTIEDTVEEYEKNCHSSKSYADAALIINKEIEKINAKNVVSVGVGKGILEWHLKRLKPDLKIDCTDYTEKALDKLKAVWPNSDNLFVFDILNGDWSQMKSYDCVIFYRISTEFDFYTWKIIFRNLAKTDIKNIIFIPTDCDTIRTMIREKITHLLNIVLRKNDTFCGWLFSEIEFKKMWNDYYCISSSIGCGKTKVFNLLHKYL